VAILPSKIEQKHPAILTDYSACYLHNIETNYNMHNKEKIICGH